MELQDRSGSEPSTLPGVIRRHPIIAFFALAYGVSWLAELVLFMVLGAPAALVVPVVTFGPTVAALTVTTLIEGRPGLGRLAGRMKLWRVGGRWYVAALVGIPLAYLVGCMAVPGAIGSFAPAAPAYLIVDYLIILTLGAVIGGPLGKNLAGGGSPSRNFRHRLGSLNATLLLGLLWAGWHFPQFLMPAWADQNGGMSVTSILVFVLTVMSISVIMTTIFNHTGGSLLLAILAHSSVNTAQAVFNQLLPATATSDIAGLIGFGMLALALLLLTRGRLGYGARSTTTKVSLPAAASPA